MESRIGGGLKWKVSKPVSAKKRAIKLVGQEMEGRGGCDVMCCMGKIQFWQGAETNCVRAFDGD